MEILNNIWNVLTIPNPDLINIIFIPTAFVENLLILLLFTAFIKISVSIKKKLI